MRPSLAIFFSHPTQHHSVMFNALRHSERIDVDVFYYDPGSFGGMEDRDFKVAVAWDVDVVRSTETVVLHNWLRGRAVNALRQCNPGVLRVLLRRRYDAVYVAGYVSVSNWLVLAFARLRGIKVFYQSDANAIELLEKRHPWWQRTLYRLYLAGVYGFLVIGDNNRAAYRLMGASGKRMVWCPYPFDAARFQAAITAPNVRAEVLALRAKYHLPADAIVIISVGKLISRKRHEDLIEIVARSRPANVYGLIIGSGPEEESLRQRIGPDGRVRITGFVNQSAMPLHYLLGDIGLVASSRDPHPLVATEMAMCGLPLVVSDKTGVWGPHDVVRPAENGFVYACGDVAAAAQHVEQLVNDASLRTAMGTAGRRLAAAQAAEVAASVIERCVATDEWPLAL